MHLLEGKRKKHPTTFWQQKTFFWVQNPHPIQEATTPQKKTKQKINNPEKTPKQTFPS